jgi:hypothetical protein
MFLVARRTVAEADGPESGIFAFFTVLPTAKFVLSASCIKIAVCVSLLDGLP